MSQAKAEVKNMEEHDNKKRTAVWLTPGVIRRMDGWLEDRKSVV